MATGFAKLVENEKEKEEQTPRNLAIAKKEGRLGMLHNSIYTKRIVCPSRYM